MADLRQCIDVVIAKVVAVLLTLLCSNLYADDVLEREPMPLVVHSKEDLRKCATRIVAIEGDLVVAGRFVELWPRKLPTIELIGIEDSEPYEKQEANTVRVVGLLTWRWKLIPKPIRPENTPASRQPQTADEYVRQYQVTVLRWEVLEMIPDPSELDPCDDDP